MKILHLVDDKNYLKTNCFQHQLSQALHQVHQIETVTLKDVLENSLPSDADLIICCLKQRTLYHKLDICSARFGQTPVVIYDQDPWEAFKDGGPYKGSYAAFMSQIKNIKTFALTTQWWVDYTNSVGIPCVFVPMGVLPEYCEAAPDWVDRSIPVGFVGTIHSYRAELFAKLEHNGVKVNIQSGLQYDDFLKMLLNIQIYVHSEDAPFTVDGIEVNMGTGLWIKDVEAASRGCFSVRNRLEGHETYLEGIETVRLYDTLEDVPGVIKAIQDMNPVERQEAINRTVDYIRSSERWIETAKILIGDTE